jgi:nucleoid-associated protein YgaU
MTKDAKLGLVIGIGLVIVIAVVFFRKDPATVKAATEPAAAAVKPKGVSVAPGEQRKAVVQHTVAPGETLFSLAQHYYHDSGRFVDIYQANREVLHNPQQLAPGTVIVIPGAEE